MPHLSIVIPVYNKAEYIAPCLHSLLAQEFSGHFEVVCVDDGSTDHSDELCDRMARDDSRIRVAHTANGGVTAARREGVAMAQGRYVMFVDADDGLLPGALQLLYDTIERTGADEVVATFRTHEGVASPVVYEGFVPVEPLIRAIITGKNRFPVLWSIIFRRELLDGVLDTPRDIIEGEDKLMQVKVLMRQPRVFFIREQAYVYTLGLPNNRRHTLQREQLYDRLLRETLAPRWGEFCEAFVLHQLKEYERFVAEGKYEVRAAYYKDAIGRNTTLSDDAPKDKVHCGRKAYAIRPYDRLVFWLPPRLARPLILLYRRLIAIKQKGL